MNKISLFIFSLALIACSQQPTHTRISGSLPNIIADTIYLVPVNDYFPGLKLQPNTYSTAVTDSTGNYNFKIAGFKSGYYQILYNTYPSFNYDIFIEPGDSLHIEKPARNSDNVFSVSGAGADKLNYLNVDSRTYRLRSLIYDTIRTDGFATAMDFKQYLDSVYKLRLSTLQKDSLTPKDLKENFQTSLHTEKASLLLEHLNRRNYLMHGTFGYHYPDAAYYSFKNELSQVDSNAGNTQLYKLAKHLLMHRARLSFRDRLEEAWWDESPTWKMSYLKAQPPSAWRDIMALSSTRDYSFELSSPGFFDSLLAFQNKLDSTYTSRSLHTLLTSELESTLHLAPGKEAPDFTLPDAEGTPRSLSDFKGKIVYIDFWGTWCYPCIQEIPDAIKLQKMYQDEPVAFLYVAMESDKKAIRKWKKFINGQDSTFGKFLDFKLFPGIHLVAEKQVRNPETQPYKINFAPTHVLIDQHGKIVSPRAKGANAISPQIDSLLHNMETH